MRTITLKNIPDELYERLKTLAKLRHRSLNNEVISCLEQAVEGTRIDPEQLRLKAKLFREKIKVHLSSEEIDRIIKEGRR